jgi:hypothetical protein
MPALFLRRSYVSLTEERTFAISNVRLVLDTELMSCIHLRLQMCG